MPVPRTEKTHMNDKPRYRFTFFRETPPPCKGCKWGAWSNTTSENEWEVYCFIPELNELQRECFLNILNVTIPVAVYERPAEKINALISSHRLTFRDLVNATGINAVNLAAIRGGKTKPTKPEWNQLCSVLKVPEDEKEAIELLYLGIDKYIQSLNDTLRPGIQE